MKLIFHKAIHTWEYVKGVGRLIHPNPPTATLWAIVCMVNSVHTAKYFVSHLQTHPLTKSNVENVKNVAKLEESGGFNLRSFSSFHRKLKSVQRNSFL